jgi:universal stress protein E
MKNTTIKRILVAIKPGTRGIPLVAPHARFLAECLGAEVRLASCIYDGQVALGLSQREAWAIAAQAGLIKAETDELERLAQSERDWGVSVSTHVCWHSPIYEGLIKEARNWQADLLVVGAHEPRFAPHTFLADVDWQLIRTCPCPLLLVKVPAFAGYRRILAAVDPVHRYAESSEADEAVLRVAAGLSEGIDAKLLLGHAYPRPEEFELVSAVEVLPGVFYGAENIEPLHRSAVNELAAEYDVPVENTILRPGDPTAVLSRIIEEQRVKLLVIGAIKRGPLEAAVLGSTGESVASHVDCDILFVKPQSFE